MTSVLVDAGAHAMEVPLNSPDTYAPIAALAEAFGSKNLDRDRYSDCA